MARLALITSKDQVPAKDHAVVDGIVKSRGALHGPFTVFLHCPELAGRLAHLGAFVRFEGSLDKRVRVLAAMTVARELDAVYVWGAQTGGGADARSAGIDHHGDQGEAQPWHSGGRRADRGVHADADAPAPRRRRDGEGASGA